MISPINKLAIINHYRKNQALVFDYIYNLNISDTVFIF
jgi:hypothetical protein